jgi:hypothetical protein
MEEPTFGTWEHGLLCTDYYNTKYCMYCGTELELKRTIFIYNPYTGKPMHKETLGCPRYGKDIHDMWWRLEKRVE